jgi:nitric oxide reductase subunit B
VPERVIYAFRRFSAGSGLKDTSLYDTISAIQKSSFMSYRKLWIALGVVLLVSFAVLGGVGIKIMSNAPPIPPQVITPDGHVLFAGTTIKDGQNAWRSIGGQELGTVWGPGSYVVPDWTADWLHRECVFILDRWAAQGGAASYAALSPEQQAALRERLQLLVRRNTYDSSSRAITVDPVAAEAFDNLNRHDADVFSNGRNAYAIPPNALSDPVILRAMSAFFWWTAWAASRDRPGTDVSYTQNWPHEPLVGNEPTGGTIVWSVVSFVLLLAGIGAMVWYFASQERSVEQELLPERDPLLGLKPTPSQWGHGEVLLGGSCAVGRASRLGSDHRTLWS